MRRAAIVGNGRERQGHAKKLTTDMFSKMIWIRYYMGIIGLAQI